ncbi:WxL protein peptidoglycan domain-containing protein [Isoptericola haloaureus]|uniref:DUF916 domain-containing protein n=1 Tax=Isoptericola haloaureus TaxID=1542902 RepID=A0ABU7Z7T3_9MICO
MPRSIARLAAGAGTAALLVAGVPGAAGAAAPGPAVTTADTDTITWSLTPADAEGADGRRRIALELEPGRSTTEHVALTNSSATSVTFDLSAADGYLTANGSFDLRAADVEPAGGGAWIELEDEITVAAGETSVIPLTVAVPEDAVPGDHPAGVAAAVSTSDGPVTVSNRVGVRVDVHVPGEVSAAVAVADVTAVHASSWNPFEPGTVDVEATLTATGNVAVAVDQAAAASGAAGLVPQARSAPTTPVDLIPGSSVRTSVQVPRVWPLGPVSVDLTVTPTPADGVDAATSPQTVTVTAWAIPWPQLLLVLLAVATVLGLRAVRAARRERLDALLAAARAEGAASAARYRAERSPVGPPG